MVPEDLEQFVDLVLDQKPGLERVDADVRQQLKTNFVEALQDQINASIIAALSPETLEAFEHVLEAGDQAAIAAFYKKHVPNLADIVAEVLMKFKTDYVGA